METKVQINLDKFQKELKKVTKELSIPEYGNHCYHEHVEIETASYTTTFGIQINYSIYREPEVGVIDIEDLAMYIYNVEIWDSEEEADVELSDDEKAEIITAIEQSIKLI